METFNIPTETDFRRWIKEVVKECLAEHLRNNEATPKEEVLLNRKEAARILRVSLVTLTDWMKRGLPYHKQRGRIYFVECEIMEYIKRRNRGSSQILGAQA